MSRKNERAGEEMGEDTRKIGRGNNGEDIILQCRREISSQKLNKAYMSGVDTFPFWVLPI